MCTTIVLGRDDERLLAANYDYTVGHGLIGTNLRETQKENGREPGEPALRWKVRYGSVTFSSLSLELPSAGINERGLCIALMWHDEGDFGSGVQHKRLDPLQWIQYQLDSHATVQEVAGSLAVARPKSQGVPLH